MTVFHVFYIPAVFIVALMIGMVIGRRNAMREFAMQQRDAREREQRRKARAAASQAD